MTHDEKKVVSNDFNRLECGYQVGIIVIRCKDDRI